MLIGRGVLSDLQRQELGNLIRASGTDRAVVDRARMALWWDDGVAAAEISHRLGVTAKTVRSRVASYASEGVAGLTDLPRAANSPSTTVESARAS